MELRDSAKGLLKVYGIVWEEVRDCKELEGMTPEMRKDVATTIFIQLSRRGFSNE